MKISSSSILSFLAFAAASQHNPSVIFVNGQANDVEVTIPCVEGALNVVDDASCQQWCTSNDDGDGEFSVINDGTNTQCQCDGDIGQACEGVNISNPIEDPANPENPIQGTPSNPIEMTFQCSDVGVTTGAECIDWCDSLDGEFASILFNNCECFTSTSDNQLALVGRCDGVADAMNPIEPDAPGSPENPIEVPIDCIAGSVNIVDDATCETFCLADIGDGGSADFSVYNVNLGLCQCFVTTSDQTLQPTKSCARPPPSTTVTEEGDPENPIEDPADPSNPMEPEPENPSEPDPENPIEPEPENPSEPEPENPIEPGPENPIEPEPENPIEPQPENPIEPEPENPVEPQPENPIEPEPENPIESQPENPIEPEPSAEEPSDAPRPSFGGSTFIPTVALQVVLSVVAFMAMM